MKDSWESEPNSGRDDFREISRYTNAPGMGDISPAALGGLLATCGNLDCRTGWLHLWRSRAVPIFEGAWSCSAACTAVMIQAALRREKQGLREATGAHRHRIPLGLVMLEQGWITPPQLRQALDAQKAAGVGKLGSWLMRQHGVQEQLVTRALSLQWSCPVLSLDYHDPESMAPLLPRLFVDAFGALPLRVAGGKILYMGFEEQLNPILALALERMLGLRVETGVVRGSLFRVAHERMLTASYPRTKLIEVTSEAPLVRVLTAAVERAKPVQARLVRVHDTFWLRLWSRPQEGVVPDCAGVEDIICSFASS